MPTLTSERSGPAGAPRLVLAHGFTQNARCWSPVDVDLADDHEVVAVDLPGHGGSSHVTGDLIEAGRWLVQAGGVGTYVGYSMGGRIALHGALAAPEQVARLVLVSATPGLTDADERQARRRADEQLADHLLTVGLPTFLEEWLALPLFAGLRPSAAHRDERLNNTATGLASSLRTEGTGTQAPLWDRLVALTMPVLLVTGEQDTSFTAVAARMATMLPDVRHVVVPHAGHTVHLEQPDAFVEVLRSWLAAVAG